VPLYHRKNFQNPTDPLQPFSHDIYQDAVVCTVGLEQLGSMQLIIFLSMSFSADFHIYGTFFLSY